LKPAWANVDKTVSQKKVHKNRAGGVAQEEGPEFKPQYRKKTDSFLEDDILGWSYFEDLRPVF
jgi:hypothetical protein